jgi:hypothetical protein
MPAETCARRSQFGTTSVLSQFLEKANVSAGTHQDPDVKSLQHYFYEY